MRVFRWLLDAVLWGVDQLRLFGLWVIQWAGLLWAAVVCLHLLVVEGFSRLMGDFVEFSGMAGRWSAAPGIGGQALELLDAANAWFPVDLCFSLSVLYCEGWLVWAGYRFIKSLIPGWTGT